MDGNKIEISTWEACKLIDLMTELDCILNDKSLDNNEYVKAYKKRMKESIRLRTNSLLKKIEKR